MEDKRVLSVSELNEYIKLQLDSDRLLANVYVRGELSNYKVYPSGHHYFTMKDENGALRCVMFRSSAGKLRFHPENGMKVIALGRVTVYPRDGAYQLYVSSLTPDGVGDLYVAFEQLRDELYRAGFFDEARKKPLPRFPERIAIITSSAGAAVHDMIRILRARYPLAKVLLLPVRVQGEEAPAEIAGAIRYANRYSVADVIITGRGGGSIEDLWAFNDKRVAKAIYDSEIPVISAVGHEPDVTISDFVADVRASTPSNAAEICVPDIRELYAYLSGARARLDTAASSRIAAERKRLEALSSRRVLQGPEEYIDAKREMLDRVSAALSASAERRISAGKREYVALASKLDALSPLKVLGRGYAIARKADGAVVRSAKDVSSGDRLTLRLKNDEITCIAE